MSELRRPFKVAPCITQRFGPTDNPMEPAMYGHAHFHTGVDYAMVTGTCVLASFGGYVTAAGWDHTGYGLLVIIKDELGLESLTAHLSHSYVRVGDAVNAGELIGLSGSTGNSTGPHLHWSVRRGGTYISPASLLFGPPHG